MFPNTALTIEEQARPCLECGWKLGMHCPSWVDSRGEYHARNSLVWVEYIGLMPHEELIYWYRQALGVNPYLDHLRNQEPLGLT